jgi:outer membrane protein assembly factor BamB
MKFARSWHYKSYWWLTLLCIGLSAQAIEWQRPLPQSSNQPATRYLAPAIGVNSVTALLGPDVVAQTDKDIVGLGLDGSERWRTNLASENSEISTQDLHVSLAGIPNEQGYFVDYLERYDSAIDTRYLAFLSAAGKLKWRYRLPDGAFKLTDLGSDRYWLQNGFVLYEFSAAGAGAELDMRRLGFTSVQTVSSRTSMRILFGRNNDTRQVVAIDTNNQVLWRTVVPNADRFSGSTAMMFGNSLVFGFQTLSGDYHLSRIDALTGAIEWQSPVLTNAAFEGRLFIERDPLSQNLNAAAEVTGAAVFLSIEPNTGSILSSRQYADASAAFVRSNVGLLIRRSPVGGASFWMQIDPTALTEQWRRLVETENTNDREYAIARGLDLILMRANSLLGRYRYTRLDLVTGLVDSQIERTHATPTPPVLVQSDTHVFAISQAISASNKPLGDTDIEITDKLTGLANQRQLAGFNAHDATSLGGGLALLGNHEIALADTSVRLIAITAAQAAPLFDQRIIRSGCYTPSVRASQSLLVLVLQPECSSQLTSLVIGLNPLTGAVLWERSLSGFVTTTLVHQNNLFLGSISSQSGSTFMRIDGDSGVTQWTVSSADFLVASVDGARNRVGLADRVRLSSTTFDTRVRLLDATSGAAMWTRQINLGNSDRPQAIKILNDGAAVVRIRATSSVEGGIVHLLRLNSLTGATEFNRQTRDGTSLVWEYMSIAFEQVGSELWLGSELNIGFDNNTLAPRAGAPTTTRINAITGQTIGTHWWSSYEYVTPDRSQTAWTPIPDAWQIGLFPNLNVRRADLLGIDTLRRSDDVSGGSIDLQLTTSTTEPSSLDNHARFTLDLRNSGQVTANNVQIKSVYLEGQQFIVRAQLCTQPINSCNGSDFPMVSVNPGQTLSFAIDALAVVASAETQVNFGRFVLIAVPEKNQMELNSDDNVTAMNVRIGPFANGFE